jgi:hypothetical protein
LVSWMQTTSADCRGSQRKNPLRAAARMPFAFRVTIRMLEEEELPCPTKGVRYSTRSSQWDIRGTFHARV